MSEPRLPENGAALPEGAVAIIGMAGQFPGAPDVATFWQNVLAGTDSITRFAQIPDGPEDPAGYVAARGVLADADLFDADFFGVVPTEAERMDPQHRLFLEACANALEDAGYVSQTYPGDIGLFGGCSLNTYLLANLCADRAFIDRLTGSYQVGEFQSALGNDKDFLTTRVAYKLNLRGPVVSVQSACATSLVAICQASQSLLNFACDMALAGGVSVTFPQERGHIHQEGGLASGDGTCRPFDAQASGTVFGHGVGVVLLKRLEDALADGDNIAAVIRGFAVTNDGADKAGYMAPGVDGQFRAITAAQAMAGIAPETIGYLEAHGTGTPLGDPIEVAALTKAFRAGGAEANGFCALGTAKANIGHLDAAAGVTGTIKAALQLRERVLPGLAHFTSPNPELHLETSPFTLSARTRDWEQPTDGTPRRAGVSAFGVGGVNAHIVLEEAPQRMAVEGTVAPQVLCLSARSPEALANAQRRLADHLEAHPATDLADAAFTLAQGRRLFACRGAITANTSAAAVAQLRAAAQATAAHSTAAKPVASPKLAFAFPGQGAQFPGMGHALYRDEPVYRAVIDECAEAAQAGQAALGPGQGLGLDLRTLLFAPATEANVATLAQTRFAQPALFATELALARLWQHWGIMPEATVGHSLGEYVAATLAGVFTAADALRLVCLRGRLMQQMAPGAMLSVPLAEAELLPYMAPFLDADLSLAAINAPRSSVLAGSLAAIVAVEAKLTAEGIGSRRLRTSHAFHSASMEPMLAEFEAAVAAVARNAPAQRFVSTVTGTWITAAEATDPAYWAAQCRKPVRYAEAVATLRAEGYNVLLESGPGDALGKLARQGRSDTAPAMQTIASLPVPTNAPAEGSLQPALAALWNAGLTPDWTALYAGAARRRVSLPTYPYQRKRFWVAPPAAAPHAQTISPLEELPSMPAAAPITAPDTAIAASRKPRLQLEISKVLSELSGIDMTPADASANFLELGFDSLLMTQATLALQRALGAKVTFRQLMEQFPSVDALADHMDAVLPPAAFQPVPAAAAAAATLPAARPVAIAATPAFVAAPDGTAQLFAQQVASLSQMFAAQIAALQAAAGMGAAGMGAAAATLQPPSPMAALQPGVSSEAAETRTSADSKTAATGVPDADVKHGSFRPVQPRVSHALTAAQERYTAGLIARYESRTPASKRATAAARPHLADPRAVAGFRPQWKEMVYPLVCDRARGSRLWDLDGNEYIDIVNGYGCIMFGHSPEFVVQAAHEQLERGVAIGPQSALAGEVAKLITELTGNERVTFCNTGSEAVMAAMRVARTVTGRDRIVYFSGDYHGTFDEVLVRKTPRGSAPVAPGIPQGSTGNITVLDYGTDESLAWIKAHADELAAVLIEPVQTRHPENKPFAFIRSIREITEASGTALILDEVVTGFRLAPGGVQEHLGLRADMCTYGKVIGGGHPIGVLSGKAQYLDALDGGAWQYGDDTAPEVGVTFFAGTFVRHPLAMAAARAVLQHLKEQGPELQRELNRKTATLAESLDRFFVERGVPSRVDHFASWFYFTFAGDAKLASLFYYAMRLKGIHIQEGYPCFLTTAHTDADLAAVEAAFRETILDMQAAGVMPGGAAVPGGGQETSPREAPMHEFALASAPVRVALTEPQREIFLAAALSEDANCAFNESLTVRLQGPVRESDLRFALDAAIARHDALRSTVSEDGEDLRFDPAYSGQIEFHDLRSAFAEEQQKTLEARIAAEGRTPFDLHNGPLVRTSCFVLSESETVLLLTAHHIVLDGWSANQLLEEVGQIYSKGAKALTALAPLLPFSSFAVRENRRRQDGEFAENERFWVDKFADRSPRLELPTDRPRPASKSYAGATFETDLGPGLMADLKKLSARHGCSLYVTLLSSFQLLLHRLTQQDDVVVGISTAAQSLLDGASLVGHAVNFLPMLSELGDADTVAEHMKRTRAALLDAQDHQEFTFGSLLRKLTLLREDGGNSLPREAGRTPLIEVQFNLEKVGANVKFDGLTADIRSNRKQFVNTDLFLNVIESAAGLHLACDYNTQLFDASTISRWLDHWAELLRNEVADPAAEVKAISVLTAPQRTQLITDFNRTAIDFGAFEAFPDAVLRQAAATPARVAIECGGRQWTYAELAEYATALARRLVAEGLPPGGLIAICIERSLEMVGAMLAVTLAGGAYVPLDPRHPRERLAGIIADAGIALLLTGRDPSVATEARMLTITGPQPRSTAALPERLAPDALAYVIYTSGSTGVPKGVAIEHAALSNLLRSMAREPGLTASDTLVAVTTLSFDIAALELLLPLTVGARLVVATDEQVTDGGLLLRLLEDTRATVLQATPGAWRILLDAGWASTALAPPLKVLCGGEALPRDLADNLLARSSDVWNVYGPTETTIWSSATRVTAGTGPLRIGPPIANTQFYVLDAAQRLLPLGAIGELCIGGAGLARGYWKRPELTAEKFVENPFEPNGKSKGRLYRTGDLARAHGDGTVELLGRSDFQVKIRGYRIELGEIEAVLAAHPAVREAIVLDRRSGANTTLMAFVDMAGVDTAFVDTAGVDTAGEASQAADTRAPIEELQALVHRHLPVYMQPQSILALRGLPRLPNGKVDRKALRELGESDGAYPSRQPAPVTLPVNEAEAAMLAIWKDVLQVDTLGTTQSIFELGADSLAIFRIAARAQREGIAIKATDIFERRTISALCDAVALREAGSANLAASQKGTAPVPAKGPVRIAAAPRAGYRLVQ